MQFFPKSRRFWIHFILLTLSAIVANNSYACDDTTYLSEIRKEIIGIGKSILDENNYFRLSLYTLGKAKPHAERISSISARCANNTSSYSSAQKMRQIKTHADDFILHSEEFKATFDYTTNSIKSQANKLDNNSGLLDFLGAVGGILAAKGVSTTYFERVEGALRDDYHGLVRNFNSF